MSNARSLIIFQMERVIELLKNEEVTPHSKEFAEVEKKLHEIRRDSVRFIKESFPWRKNSRG